MWSHFIEITKESFRFLEGRFGFRPLSATSEQIPYQSSEVLVNVFYRRLGGELGVEFGMLPEPGRAEAGGEFWRALFPSRERLPKTEARIPVYELKVALPVLVPPALMPAELRKLLGDRQAKEFDPLETWDSWWSTFSASNLREVDIGVRRLAVITLEYASPLLTGDREAFRKVQEYNAQLTDQYSRKVHLGFLPKPLAEALKDKPLSEIIQARKEREGW